MQHKIIEPCCGASEDISGAPPRLGARLPLRGVARTYSSSRMARRLGDPIYPTTSAARLAASFRVSASRAHRVHEKRLAVLSRQVDDRFFSSGFRFGWHIELWRAGEPTSTGSVGQILYRGGRLCGGALIVSL